MKNYNSLPSAEEFLKKDESGVFNEADITQAMIEFAKLHVKAAFSAGFNIGYGCHINDVMRKEGIYEDWSERYKIK